MNLQATLSPRESQMATGIVMGLCKKEISEELSISTRTVEETIRNIMIKIEVKKSTEIVVYWFVRHFSIPIDQLPKSITALVFLILFCSYEYIAGGDVLRARRTRTEEVRNRRKDDYPIIEI